MIARIGIMTMGLVDTVIVGRYGTEDLAYIALAWAVMGFVLVSGLGLLQGVQVFAARRIGQKRQHLAGAAWRRGVALAAIAGAVLAAPLLIGADVFRLLGQSEALAVGAGSAMRILALSVPLHLLFVAHSYYLEATGRPMVPVYFMAAANVLNFVANIWFVYGGFGLPEMGADGAAWATLLVRILLAGGLAAFIWFSADAVRFGVRTRPVDDDPGVAREQIRLGVATASGLFFEGLAFSAMTVIAGWSGAEAAAAYTVFLNTMALLFMVALGFASASGVLVSEAVGAGDAKAARDMGWLGLGVNAAAMALMAVAAAIFREPLAALFTNDPALIVVLAPMFLLMAAAIVFDGTQVVASFILRARSDAWFATASHFVSYGVIMVPAGFVLGHFMGRGALGMAEAIVIASVVSGTILTLRWAWLCRRDSARAAAA